MADEVDRTPAEAENDQTAMESALNTPVSDPALEATRKQIARAADKKFQAAAEKEKALGQKQAEFEAQQAEITRQIRAQAYNDYVNAGWMSPEDRRKLGLLLDEEREAEAEGEGEAEEGEPKPVKKPAAKSETVTIPARELAELKAQLQSVNQRLDANDKAQVSRQEKEFYREFYACVRKLPDAFPDPDTQDPDVIAALDRDARRAFAYWLRPDGTGLSDFDRGVPLESKVKQVAKENVAARKAIDSRKKPTAPHPSQRGDATHEGPGAGGAIPEKLQKMDIDSKGFDTEVAKLLGNIGLE